MKFDFVLKIIRRYYLRKKAKRDLKRLRRRIIGSGHVTSSLSPHVDTPNTPKKPRLNFIIDIVGTCNLRCPSCPTGNWTGRTISTSARRMSPALLTKIMDKAVRECDVPSVSLYNWTEPLLHPELPELIRIIQSRRIPCTISSNLNQLKDPDVIMKAEPCQFHVSVSGFTQKNYAITHRGGSMDRVKENMVKLAESRQRTGSKTYLKLIFHRYLNNVDDEVQMKEFAEDLGYRFEPNWAIFMPLEKSMAYVDPDSTGIILSPDDIQTIDNLALDLKGAFALSSQSRIVRCPLRDSEMVLDCEGNVLLCCGIYDSSTYKIGTFLSQPLTEIHARKYTSPMCGKCMQMGGHGYLTHRFSEHDRLALETRRTISKPRDPGCGG